MRQFLGLDRHCTIIGSVAQPLPDVFGRTNRSDSLSASLWLIFWLWESLGPSLARSNKVHHHVIRGERFPRIWRLELQRPLPALLGRTHNTHAYWHLTPDVQTGVLSPCSGRVAQSRSTQLPAISGCSTQPENRCRVHWHPTSYPPSFLLMQRRANGATVRAFVLLTVK